MERWRERLGRRVDAGSLACFRIAWGVILALEAVARAPRVQGLYSPSAFHFKYELFRRVGPRPEEWMLSLEVWLAAGAGVAIALGAGLRGACLLYALIYTHFLLIEKAFFNNHFYLTILITGLLAFTGADRRWSLRARREPGLVRTLPFWNLALLRGQMLVVYFYGGVAKLNPDWLRGEPVRHWLQSKQDLLWPLSELVRHEWFVQFVAYSGILIDLSAGFLLLHRRTFWPTAALLVGFHVTNSQLFQIGYFPLIGVVTLLLFADPRWFARRGAAPAGEAPGERAGALTTAAVAGYLALQALLPLRAYLYYDQSPSWTEVGHSFSWRMMLRDKDGWARFVFDPPESERMLEQTQLLLPVGADHLKRMAYTPHYLLQYAQMLGAVLRHLGQPDVAIRVLTAVSMNGRPYQPIVDPNVDLSRASYGFFEVPAWIVPLAPGEPGGYPATPEARAQAIEAGLRAWGIARGVDPQP